MKTIIVPTDFSPSADNAAQFAAHLAQQVAAEVLLLHIYQIPVSMNDMPVMLLSADELKTNADEHLNRHRHELQESFPTLSIKTESRLGDVNDELDDLCQGCEPFAIVLGNHEVSGFERLLFGSTTLSVMRHANYPVIAVPENHQNTNLQKIVLAADLLDAEKIPTEKIIEMVQQLNGHLHIVHVVHTKEETNEQSNRLLKKFRQLQPSYDTILHENVKDGLLRYLDASGADLLLLLPHEHSLMERLFFKPHTEDIVQHAKLPVMAIKC